MEYNYQFEHYNIKVLQTYSLNIDFLLKVLSNLKNNNWKKKNDDQILLSSSEQGFLTCAVPANRTRVQITYVVGQWIMTSAATWLSVTGGLNRDFIPSTQSGGRIWSTSFSSTPFSLFSFSLHTLSTTPGPTPPPRPIALDCKALANVPGPLCWWQMVRAGWKLPE